MKAIFRHTIITALRLEAQLVLYKYKPYIIAITGSVGKTSTKDAVYAVMSEFTDVRRSEKSFNSEIGLPLTILGLPNAWNNPVGWLKNFAKGLKLILLPNTYPKWLVLEVGVGKPGDMERTGSWLRTDAVIITAIGETPAHVEFFASRKHLIEEKSALIKTLKKDGILILNADDKDVLAMHTKTKNIFVTYGFTESAHVVASSDTVLYSREGIPEGVIYRIDEEGRSLPVAIEGVFGRNHVYASLAALTLASGLKLNMVTAVNALKRYDVPPGRMRLLRGINGSIIIDDSYNSSPLASESALKTLGEVTCTGRKIAVLGDMLELGRHTHETHKNIGSIVKKVADVLVVVGPRAKSIAEGALEVKMAKKNIYEFSDAYQAAAFLKSFVSGGDVVLIKGSQGMRMERVTESILLDQEHKNKLLVRQDAEWKKKK